MDPTHKTLLRELLQRATSMPVHEAIDAQRIEPDSVYVITPDSELTVVGGALHVARPAEPRGQRLPIDVLFSSLARELGERAVGVVLSGMGSDGTQGLQAIKTQGGLTLAQQPESAQFDSMPRSAIATGCVDIVALPADMPARISSIVGTAPCDGSPPAGPADPDTSALATILELLHQHTRHDLTLYKSNTLVRRIARRIAVHGLGSMAAYADFLRANAQELELLFKEMLIGVTSFFRDPEVWQDLQDKVLPVLMERHAEDTGPMRAWVVGCSTGEEAYSLAIAFTEAQDALPTPARRELQIFATDLNADAIAAARSGRFAATIARDLTSQRLARFFSERPDGYQVDKRIRDMVLFAQHDVTMDPPFTRLDIVSCRNLMIYFGAGAAEAPGAAVPLQPAAWRRAVAGRLGNRRPRPLAVPPSCTRSRDSTGAATMAATSARWSFRPTDARPHVRPRRRLLCRTSTRPRRTFSRSPINCCCSRIRRRRCW